MERLEKKECARCGTGVLEENNKALTQSVLGWTPGSTTAWGCRFEVVLNSNEYFRGEDDGVTGC